MRFLFTSTAGLGHLLPLLSLARTARESGHDVVLASPAAHADRITAAGLAHAVVAAPTDADRQAARDLRPGDFVAAGKQIFGSLNPRAAYPRIASVIDAWKPDAVISEGAEFAGPLAAERAGLPVVRIHPGLAGLTVWEELAAPILDELRTELGLRTDPSGHWLLERPQVGYFPSSFDPAGEREPLVTRVRPRDLPVAGRERDLVYVTFGTELVGQPSFPDLARVCATAAATTGLEVVVSIAHADRDAVGDLGAARVERWVDHRSILPRGRAVICHGGAGTLLGALAAGTPVIAIPFFADQPYNAAQLAATGTGSAVPPGPDLGLRIGVALDSIDAGTYERCAAIAAEIARLPDIDRGVEVITAAGKPSRSPSARAPAAAGT